MKYIPIMLLITIMIIPAVTLLTLRKEVGLKQTEEGKIVFFSGNQGYQFSFTSPKDNLKDIVLKLKNPSIRPAVGRNSKSIYFDLVENQKKIRHIQINGSNIIDNSNVHFTFPVIEDSKNKIFTIILDSPDTQKKEELGINTDIFNNPVIITYHTPASKLQLIINIYRNLASKILSDKIFIAIWLMFFYLIMFAINTHCNKVKQNSL